VPALALQAKLTLFAALLVLVAVSATSVVAWRLLERQAEAAARARLDHAAEVVAGECTNLLENARITAEILAARPPLQRSLVADDADALAAILRSTFRTRAADRIAVVGPDGVARVEVERGRAPARGTPLRADEAVAQALGGAPAEGLEVTPGGVRVVAALPVRAGDEILGAVVVTSNLDEALADRLKRATSFDITFYAGDRAAATSVTHAGGTREIGAAAPADVRTQVVGGSAEVERVSRGPGGRTIVRYAPCAASPAGASACTASARRSPCCSRAAGRSWRCSGPSSPSC
jgi:hypothetical protein